MFDDDQLLLPQDLFSVLTRPFYGVWMCGGSLQVANLSLMALGSSAPEILLSVIGVVTTLGEEADCECGLPEPYHNPQHPISILANVQ